MVLLVKDIGVPGENHRHAASHWQIYHIMLYRVHLAWVGFKLTTLVVILTACTCSYISNYHTITTALKHTQCAMYIMPLKYIYYIHLNNIAKSLKISKLYIEEWQTIQWPKEKWQTTIYKTCLHNGTRRHFPGFKYISLLTISWYFYRLFRWLYHLRVLREFS